MGRNSLAVVVYQLLLRVINVTWCLHLLNRSLLLSWLLGLLVSLLRDLVVRRNNTLNLLLLLLERAESILSKIVDLLVRLWLRHILWLDMCLLVLDWLLLWLLLLLNNLVLLRSRLDGNVFGIWMSSMPRMSMGISW